MNVQTLNLLLLSKYKFDVLLLEDIATIAREYQTIYRLLQSVKKESYHNSERVVFYTQYEIPVTVLQHLQQAVTRLAIPNFVVLLITPTDCSDELDAVRISHSIDDNCMSHLLLAVDSNPITVSKLIPLPSNFCFHPWVNMEVGPGKSMSPCCVYKQKFESDESISEAYTSSPMVELRRSFHNNMKHPNCSVCWDIEEHGGYSHRLAFINSKDPAIHSAAIEEILPPISNLISLDTKHGNACNLKCRICSEKFSSSIMIENAELVGIPINRQELQLRASNLNMFEQIRQMIESADTNLQYLEFYGGEPFMFKKHKQFLTEIVQSGRAKDINLHYNTNGTFDVLGFVPLWDQFKSLNLSFSVDDIGHRFEYQRHGAKWDVVNENIRAAMASGMTNADINVYITVSIFNIMYLEDVVNWSRALGIPDTATHFNVLDQPSKFKVVNFPPMVGYKIRQHLSRCKDPKFAPLLTMLGSASGDKGVINDFYSDIAVRDKHRNECFGEIFHELNEILTEAMTNA